MQSRKCFKIDRVQIVVAIRFAMYVRVFFNQHPLSHSIYFTFLSYAFYSTSSCDMVTVGESMETPTVASISHTLTNVFP